MSNNYLQFSFAIPNLTDAETAWIREYLAHVKQFAEYERDDALDGPADDEPIMTDADKVDPFLMAVQNNGSFGFSWAIDEDGLWIYAEESGDPDIAATLMQQFLKAHRPTSYVGFEWAATCSKMRLNEFGGGGVMVTATDCEYLATGLWLTQQGNLLRARGLTAA